ncbi:MAG TPA: hypothetical protein VJT75_05825 [Thermoleophilaceae bacterium]|nr:hypothetical protein [Thermoleophilaceae bacterium]
MGFAFVLGAADRGQFVSVAFLVATAVFLLVLYRDLDRIGGTGAHGACMVLPMGAVFAALGLERLTDAGNVAVLGGALPLLAATVLIGERARRRGTARLR